MLVLRRRELHTAPADEHRHTLCAPAQSASKCKEDKRHHEDPTATKNVSQVTGKWKERCSSEGVCRSNPYELLALKMIDYSG